MIEKRNNCQNCFNTAPTTILSMYISIHTYYFCPLTQYKHEPSVMHTPHLHTQCEQAPALTHILHLHTQCEHVPAFTPFTPTQCECVHTCTSFTFTECEYAQTHTPFIHMQSVNMNQHSLTPFTFTHCKHAATLTHHSFIPQCEHAPPLPHTFYPYTV